MKILVLWADRRSANLGVRVLAEGAMALAHRAWGEEASVTFQDFAGSETGINFGPRSALKDVVGGRGHISSFISGFDVVLDTGAGDSFTDIYGFKRFANMVLVQRRVIRQNVPLVFSPQTIGPFSNALSRGLARRMLAKSSTLAVRDHESGEAAAALGRTPDVVSSDLVFMLDQPQISLSERPPRGMLNVSGLLWSDNPHVDWRQYRKNVGSARDAVERAGLEPILFPHVLDSPFADNDVRVLEEVQAYLGGDIATSVPRDLSAARAEIAQSRLVIGARMHACLNALSVGVPAIPMAYSRKFAPLLQDLGWNHTTDAGASGTKAAMSQICSASLGALEFEAREVRVRGKARVERLANHLATAFRGAA